MKQFKTFSGKAKSNFRELMIEYWMKDEKSSRTIVMQNYVDEKFDELCERVTTQTCIFDPDLGYTDKSIDGMLCFERIDDNCCIPVEFIEVQ